MVFTVANEVTSTPLVSLVDKPEIAVSSRRYDRRIEIDQVRIICQVALCSTDTVRIMTCVTWRTLAADMFVMLTKALIAENAVAAMATVAERIISGALWRIVGGHIVTGKNRLETRTVRPFRP